MASYNLQPNESMIMNKVGVIYGRGMGSFSNELILTNLNIVLVSKGAFGNVKGTKIFPLSQIKVFNGQAQALLGKTNGGYPQLDVYFLNGQENFGFESKKDVTTWISNINKLVTGNECEVDTSPNIGIPGAEYAAEILKGTVDTFKGVFGIKSNTNGEIALKVARKCSYCGASISGTKGQITRCSYCDADQQL